MKSNYVNQLTENLLRTVNRKEQRDASKQACKQQLIKIKR